MVIIEEVNPEIRVAMAADVIVISMMFVLS
jgi:hypothetical protein